MLGTPPAFILSQDQTLRSILVCRFPVRGNRRVSINSKIKVNSKKYQINVLSGMYQSVFRGACLACPRFVTVSGSQGAEGLGPDARASLRRKKELYQHPACRVKENFQEIFPTRCGGAGALRARAPRVSPCEQGFRGWSLSLYQHPPFCEGGNLNFFEPPLIPLRHCVQNAGCL